MRALAKLSAIALRALGADAAAQSQAPSGAAPLPTMSLHASVVAHPAPFKKYLYSFPLPAKVALRGLSVSVSTSQKLPAFSEALISLHELASGRCAPNGEVYDTEEIGKNQPFREFHCEETAASRASRRVLPQGIPIQNCVVAILDGSILTGGAFTMTSDMSMTYAAEPPSAPPHIIGLDEEFCFGQSRDVSSTENAARRVRARNPVAF
jgi:hypothetical protein